MKLEEAFREYDKISPQPLAAEMKFAILLRCITGQLRMHINVTLKEDASYDTLRETVLQYDRANIRWTEAMALGTSRTDDGGPAPMEVDRVKDGKGKDKGKKGNLKGKDLKGSSKGKHSKSDGGKSKGQDKGKSKDYGKHGKSAGQGRGRGPLPADTCKLCGGRGHRSRECPVRTLRQVAQTQDGGSSVTTQSMVSSGGSGTQPAQGSLQSTAVRRIIQVDLDDLDETMDEPVVRMLRMVKAEETYDMTYSDSDDDWLLCTECGDGCNAYFMDYANDTMNVAVELEVTGGSRPLVDEGAYIRGVRLEDDIPIVLDSGADMSVLPMKYKDIGFALWPLAKQAS